MSTVFLLSWDMTGLECIVNVSELEKQKMWNTLKDKPAPDIFTMVNSILIRARYNPQRHYEVYTITVTDGITEDDLRDMFENDPQTAADLIRERGNQVYSDRISTKTQRIV